MVAGRAEETRETGCPGGADISTAAAARVGGLRDGSRDTSVGCICANRRRQGACAAEAAAGTHAFCSLQLAVEAGQVPLRRRFLRVSAGAQYRGKVGVSLRDGWAPYRWRGERQYACAQRDLRVDAVAERACRLREAHHPQPCTGETL